MIDFKTHCKGCMFANLKAGQQISCSLNKAPDERKTVDNYFFFDNYCKFYRDAEWLKECGEESPEEKVTRETKIRVGLAIDFTDSYDEDKLKQTLLSFPEAEYIILINDKPEYNKNLFDIVKFCTKLHSSRIHIVQIIEQSELYYMDEAFKFARNGYFCYVQNGEILPSNFYEKITQTINVEMKPLSVCFGGDKILVQSMLFKYLGGNKSRIDKDGAIDSRTFAERVYQMPKTEQCIYDWDKLFYE